MANKITCYLDMDGLLTDFVLAAHRAHGRERDLDPASIKWDFNEALGIPAKEFYTPMGYDFWKGVPWTREGKEFLARVEQIFGEENIVLLSSPVETEGGVEGKIAWIKREMPNYSRRFFIGPPKFLLASRYKVLIDDNDKNINDFRNSGGTALLVPRPWNTKAHQTNKKTGDFDPAAVAEEVSQVHLNLLWSLRKDEEGGCL